MRKPANRKPPSHFLRQWRVHRSLTLERAAERAEMATSNLSQLETGKTGVSDENLSALAHAYDCEVGDLFRDPTRPDYELWRIIVGMKSDDRERVLKMVKALAEVA